MLSFEISDMLAHDYIVRCSSSHAFNNTLTQGLWFSDRGRHGVDMSDNVGGINVTIDENGLGGGRSSVTEITIKCDRKPLGALRLYVHCMAYGLGRAPKRFCGDDWYETIIAPRYRMAYEYTL